MPRKCTRKTPVSTKIITLLLVLIFLSQGYFSETALGQNCPTEGKKQQLQLVAPAITSKFGFDLSTWIKSFKQSFNYMESMGPPYSCYDFKYMLVGDANQIQDKNFIQIAELFRNSPDKVDMTFLTATEYAVQETDPVRGPLDVMPFLGLSISGSKTYRDCVYVNKGSKIKSLKDLKDKPVTVFVDYLGLHELFRRDVTPDVTYNYIRNYFGDVVYYNDEISSFYELKTGRIDAVMVSTGIYNIMKIVIPSVTNNVEPVVCGDVVMPNGVFVMSRKTNNYEKAAKDVAYVMRKGKNQFKQVFNMMGAEFYDLDESYLEDIKALALKARKEGWMDDRNKWIDSIK